MENTSQATFLLIDTCFEQGYIALFHSENQIDRYAFATTRQSRSMVLEIKNLLQRHGLTLDDLAFIAISKGPGSYTSIRVGILIASVLSYTHRIPLIPYHALIPLTPPIEGKHQVYAPAGRDKVFMQEVRVDPKGAYHFLGEVSIVPTPKNSTPMGYHIEALIKTLIDRHLKRDYRPLEALEPMYCSLPS